MRLKRVDKTRDDWQKCCRWCHYYEKGKCMNKDLFHSDENSGVLLVAESGYLSEALEETLKDEPLISNFMREVVSLFDKWGNISQKRKAEFIEHFKECWEQFADFELKENLDESVSLCFLNHLEGDAFNGVTIKNPEEFRCKEWC